MALVDPDILRTHLTAIGSSAQALAVAEDAARAADVITSAYCSRLVPGEPVPGIVRQAAFSLAARLASNPKAIRAVSAEGQSMDLPPVGFTYLENLLLAPYRRRTA